MARASTFRSSEEVERGFCNQCGTPLFYHHLGGQHVSISIGAFDEPHRIEILYQMGMEGKHPSLMHLNDIEECGTTEEANPDSVEDIRLTNHQHPDHDTAQWPPK